MIGQHDVSLSFAEEKPEEAAPAATSFSESNTDSRSTKSTMNSDTELGTETRRCPPCVTKAQSREIWPRPGWRVTGQSLPVGRAEHEESGPLTEEAASLAHTSSWPAGPADGKISLQQQVI